MTTDEREPTAESRPKVTPMDTTREYDEEQMNEEAARYLAAVVPGWEQMAPYMQLVAVRQLVQHTIANLEEARRGQ